MESESRYKRIVLKFSGEVLAGESGTGIDLGTVNAFARQINECAEIGVQIAIVNGGGNFFRGLSEKGKRLNRVISDHIGMLATVMNSLAIKDALTRLGRKSEVFSAIRMDSVCRPLIVRDVISYLEEGYIALLTGGTGNPFFSTDSAAALRAAEIGADVIIKGTKVEGVYDKDPLRYPDAEFFPELTFDEAINRNLHVMDQTAFTLCKENNIPIVVYNMKKNEYLLRILKGEKIGTKVSRGNHD